MPIGRGRIQLEDGWLVVSGRRRELLRVPLAHVQEKDTFGFITAVRKGRRWVPRMWFRAKFLTPDGQHDKETRKAWNEAWLAYENWQRLAPAWMRAERASRAADACTLGERAWRRTGPLSKERGKLRLEGGWLSFETESGPTWRAPFDDVASVRTPWWRTGRMVVKASGERQVFGFDPRRRPDGAWEKGETGIDGANAGLGLGSVSLAHEGDIGVPIGSSEEVNALMIMGLLIYLPFEGGFVRRARRADWRRVLRREQSPQALLEARALDASRIYDNGGNP
jgi:hypothetical protein